MQMTLSAFFIVMPSVTCSRGHSACADTGAKWGIWDTCVIAHVSGPGERVDEGRRPGVHALA